MTAHTRSTIQFARHKASTDLTAKGVAVAGNSPVAGIHLPQDQIWRIEGEMTGMVIECLAGLLWITQQGDANDYVLSRSDLFRVTQPGVVLVQAVREARFTCRWERGRM